MAGRSYAHQLDAKNRMRIPAKMREELGQNYTIMAGSNKCLYVYPEKKAEKIIAKLRTINPFDEKKQAAARKLLSLTWQAEEDKQGRILIPENIREHAAISKNVLLFYGPSCIELWAEDVWNDYISKVDLSCLADVFEDSNDNE
jgi:MraZ protein